MNPLFILYSSTLGYTVALELVWGGSIMVFNSRMRNLRFSALGILLAVLLGAGQSQARGDGHDHDRARQAVEAGEVLPLRTILERIEPDYPGQVMEVELEHRDDRWIYEITVLRTSGALVRLKVDGRDGRLLRSKEGPRAEGRHRKER